MMYFELIIADQLWAVSSGQQNVWSLTCGVLLMYAMQFIDVFS